MYIASELKNRTLKFFIRESYMKNGIYLFRTLMELEDHPASYISYINERSFYIKEIVEDTIALHTGDQVAPDHLEEIFWPYIRPEIRRRFELGRSRTIKKAKASPILSDVHLFDKKRLHYLRTGLKNQGNLLKASANLFHAVVEKSRDEIEQYFMAEERILNLRELKTYVYVIFDLHRYFNKIFAREMPEALDEGQIADYFINDICALNQDNVFWAGFKKQEFLRDYLKRYVVMFFDSDFGERSFWEEILSRNIHDRRYHRPVKRPREHVLTEASVFFGIPEDELQKMTKRELTKIYRRKAREFHPDSGGSHEQFLKLSKVYDELMGRA